MERFLDTTTGLLWLLVGSLYLWGAYLEWRLARKLRPRALPVARLLQRK